jgi:uncharacterized protein YdcH (DUF465 family)
MKEADIINALRSESEEFKKLEEEHRKLEETLSDFNKKKYLSPEEEMVKKNIQKQKLQFKDRMASLVRRYDN